MKLKNVVLEGDPEIIASGFEFTEGPVWHKEGFLLFSDIPANRVYRWSPEGVSIYHEPSSHSNGLALDADGNLLLCQHGARAVARLSPSGSMDTLADSYEQKPLNSPNDLAVRSDGSIYFTDPPYGIQPDEIEQTCNGVYRLHTDGSINRIKNDFIRPNGIAFNQDESILYVADSGRRHVRAISLTPQGLPAQDRIFADMDHPQPGSPDGIKVDQEGYVYVAGPTGLWIFSPAGVRLGVIVTPERPANCAWGDRDRKSLYITARTSLYRIRTHFPGLPDIRFQ